MTYSNKNIKIVHDKNFALYSINSRNILVLNTLLDKKYLLIPSFIKTAVDETTINFQCASDSFSLFNNFKGLLNNWLKNLNRPFRKKLYLKGLGFKISISDDKKKLLLKLGYSHMSSIDIPTDRLFLKISKNLIIVEGFDSVEVGNFASKIRHLRLPDIYKGKGVWYKNEIKVLKELKKK